MTNDSLQACVHSIHSTPHWRHNHWVTTRVVSLHSGLSQWRPSHVKTSISTSGWRFSQLSDQRASHVLTTLRTQFISIIDCSCYQCQGASGMDGPQKGVFLGKLPQVTGRFFAECLFSAFWLLLLLGTVLLLDIKWIRKQSRGPSKTELPQKPKVYRNICQSRYLKYFVQHAVIPVSQ